jgi:HAD superfamily hydrolase (TIGR01484 family)
MRIAVSDYDGTLCKNGIVSIEDIEAINAWRETGNLFGIATGRDLSLITYCISQWNIPFDFLICVNGAILYDDKLNLLRSINIPDALVKETLLHPAARASMHYQLCTDGVNKIYIQNPDSYFNSLDVTYESITYEQALIQNNLQQISLAYTTKEELIERACALSNAFGDRLCLNINNVFIDINEKSVNKLKGILDILAIKRWPAEGLLVIGDEENDIPMIRRFKGFSISSASGKVAGQAAAVYNSVGDMLTSHM